MSLFRNPEEHAANAPETWVIVKVADRAWRLQTKDGDVLEQNATHKACAESRDYWWTRQYEKESRWYAGESVDGWKDYANV